MPKRRIITLEQMQAAARKRHEHPVIKNRRSDDLWDGFLMDDKPVIRRKKKPKKRKTVPQSTVKLFIEEPEMVPEPAPMPKIDFTKMDIFKKEAKSKEPKIGHFKELPVVPDKKVVIYPPTCRLFKFQSLRHR